jgi:cob(I)alamin adenosyltransferase
MSKIYTKTGDKGKTSLYNGEKVYKNNSFCEVVGTLDEISSAIGCVYLEIEMNTNNTEETSAEPSKYIKEILNDLQWVQSRLLDLGSHVATPNNSKSSEKKLAQTAFSASYITDVEKRIDYYDEKLPALKNFILPYGATHVCRSVTRRCERSMIALLETEMISLDAYIFINRLSDFFFVLGRFISIKLYNKTEIVYKKDF